MELTLTPPVALMATLAVLALSSVVWQWQRRRRSRQKAAPNLPPGPRGWPVFGSLISLLADPLPPHRALAALASRHGAPLMHLRIGSFGVVVASSAEAARLVLKTHDLAFAGRPPTAFGEILSYGYRGIVQTPYGPYWRMARRLCAAELLSPPRVGSFELARALEMRAMTHALFVSSAGGGAAAVVEVKEHLMGLTMRNILRMAVGDKWSRCYGSEEGEAFRRALGEAFAVVGAVSAGEWVPWLRWLDAQGLVRRMKRVHRLFDRFLEQMLAEHERDRRGGELVARDLVDVLLQRSEEEEEQEARLTRDGVKAIITDVIAGGTEPVAVTAEWAMAELLRRPEAMSAAAAELDRVVGRERWATERDLMGLPYLEAVVKETMRLHPVAPLLSPRCAREDTAVVAAGGGGYDVPAGTRVLVNAWAVARDPAAWPDAPGEFRPERFLAGGSAEGVDVRGAHFHLLPFGAGRRMCPAYNLGFREVAAMVASMVQGFTWRLQDGVAPEDVAMEEFFELNVRAVVEPRLPAHLYAAVQD
ncbi:unnamed protein product [Urochloa humidicola]